MRKLLKNRVFAVFLLIAVFIIVGLVGTRNSLSSKAEEVTVIFTAGENGDGDSISKNLEERAKLAYELIGISKSYLAEDSEALTSVISARDRLNDAGTVNEKSEANRKLTEAVIDLNSELVKNSLSDSDESRREYLIAALDNENDNIRSDVYNTKAAEFNQILNTFPTNYLALIVGISEIEVFE